MNKKLTLIIGLQAILIIALFWVLIFYGKDEYEAYQAEQSEEIESPSRVVSNEGISIVSLPLATQKNSGIQTAKVQAAIYQAEIKSVGTVVAIDSLIEAKSNYLSIQSQINLARAASGSNLAQYMRLKTLNADDKNVSDLVLQQALALVNADKANITAAELQLKNLQNNIKLQWGEALASLAFKEKLAPHLAGLLNRNNVLVQISLPYNTVAPVVGSVIKLSPINNAESIISAVYVSAAATSDTNGFGKTFYYSAPAQTLRIGMRVNVEVLRDIKINKDGSHDSTTGVIIPSNAVVWYAGKPWAYFKQGKTKDGDDQFVRRPIAADAEVDSGWFNQGLSENVNEADEVVVSGAQLLLSEEFKYLIKNENED